MPTNEQNGMTDAEIFYSSDKSVRSGFEPAIKDAFGMVGDVQGWTPVQREEMLTELSHNLNDARLSNGEASILMSHIAAFSKAPPTDEQVWDMEMESRKALREQYGSDVEA